MEEGAVEEAISAVAVDVRLRPPTAECNADADMDDDLSTRRLPTILRPSKFCLWYDILLIVCVRL